MQVTLSSKGRQLKKNSKYLDYEIDDGAVEQYSHRTPRRSSGGRRAASQKPPANRKTAKTAPQHSVDGGSEGADKTPSGCDGQTAAETAHRPARGRKTASRRTPARKTPARKAGNTDVDFPGGEGVVKDTVQQQNGTPKPKRKYVKQQPVQRVEPVKEDPEEPEEETGQGGRRRRGAAKA